MKPFCKRLLSLLLLIQGAVVPSFAQTDSVPPFQHHGYLKLIPTVAFRDRADSVFSEQYIHHRSSFRYKTASGTEWRADMRNRVYYGELVRMQPEFADIIDDDTGLVRLSVRWIDEPGLLVYSSIDRLTFTLDRTRFRLVLGRQRINWGMTTVWNPNDLFNAWNYLDFDYEERPGSDAVRLKLFPSNTTSLELAWSPADRIDRQIAGLLWQFNRSAFDFQVLAGQYREDLVLGGGFAGNLGEAGFRGEVTAFRPTTRTDASAALSASINLDRTFRNDWYCSISALYNSMASPGVVSLSSRFRERVSPRQLMPWKWNVYAQALKHVSPPVSLSLGVTWSPTEQSTVFLPALSWAVSNEVDLDLIGQSFFTIQDSRYRTAGTSLFIRTRISY